MEVVVKTGTDGIGSRGVQIRSAGPESIWVSLINQDGDGEVCIDIKELLDAITIAKGAASFIDNKES